MQVISRIDDIVNWLTNVESMLPLKVTRTREDQVVSRPSHPEKVCTSPLNPLHRHLL
jgi:hypothetical protein